MSSGVSTAGLLQNSKSEFLLAYKKPGGDIGNKWEFPGGKMEPGETPETALAREWEEELGIKITVGEHLCEGNFHHFEKTFRLTAYFITTRETPVAGPEHEKLGWFSVEEMANLDMPESDRIIVGALIKYRSRRKESSSSE